VLRSNGEDLPAIAVRLDDEANYANGPESRAPRSALGLARPSKRPVLSVNLSDTRPPDAAYFAFLRLIAASLAQATGRVNARDAERAIGEALQRSLLTKPAQTDDTQVAVRYLPAAMLAQIGGDWYDAFNAQDGTLMLAVGDVNGHDQEAAVAMAQVRNLLRGVAYTTHGSPARVLTTLDTAMVGLEVGLYATAILARVEVDDSGRTLRWSNAGHPPPVLIAPDGRASMLETTPEVLLGLAEGERSDHAVALEPGATVVFYTDGLVERRRVPLQAGFDWLLNLLEGVERLDAETICDRIVSQVDETVDDDIVLLVLRAV
jgi:serine phosphatase RsbU (regulator of sigma subunit)